MSHNYYDEKGRHLGFYDVSLETPEQLLERLRQIVKRGEWMLEYAERTGYLDEAGVDVLQADARKLYEHYKFYLEF